MKIIAIERQYDAPLHAAATEALAASEAPSPSCQKATLLTDSALVRARTPLFVPDFALREAWILEVVPMIVISRLGKWIENRFARRYYDAVGLAARLLPPEGIPSGAFAANFDGAFAPGALTLTPEEAGETLTIEAFGTSLTLGPEMLSTDSTIALASRFMTLRTGDIISLCRTPLRTEPVVGSSLTATINDREILNLKLR